jgi:putative glycosyl hydrolase-like family 15 (GHL15) protein
MLVRALTLLAALVLAGTAQAAPVPLVQHTSPAFDAVIEHPTASAAAWMRERYFRMVVFSPYFDTRLAWYGRGWVYKDLYGLPAGSHPGWVLRDARGRRLYLNFGCAHGRCPQWAADITNPAYRASWIQHARATLANGYRGLWIDDVNLNRSVSSGSGAPAEPVSAAGALTETRWAQAVAAFAAQIRAALPGAEIVHNAVWFAARSDAAPAGTDPSVRAQIGAADWVNLERGCSDPGLTGGDGRWSLRALLAYVDQVHAQGRSVVWQPYGTTGRGRELNLACLLLARRGRDALDDSDARPSRWWTGFGADPGAPWGGRYDWNGLLRRDYSRAVVLVNDPGAGTRTVTLPGRFTRVDGTPVRGTLTIPGGRGVVLLRR